MNVNGKTRIVGLLGYPLGHSLSPQMQNAAFEDCSINSIYIPIEVKPEDLGTVVRGISKMNFDGFNVTIPHKVEIMKYLDEIDEYAKLIGAVNTVAIKDGRLIGYNTDGIGFKRSFEENTKETVEGKSVFILGAGGASRAISMTLAMNNAKKIYICNRTYEKAVNLSNDIKSKAGSLSEAVPMECDEMKRAIADSHVLINATSIGMYPNIQDSPLDKSLLNRNLIVCDAVYNPRKTRLLQYAEELGCKIVPGIYMLVYQGVESFELWTDIKAPVDIMFNAVKQSLD